MNSIILRSTSSLRATICCMNLPKLCRRHLSSSVTEEKIVKSPAPFLDLPKGNYVDTLFKDIHKWNTKTALECCETGRKVSYEELLDQSATWSGFLKQNGVSKGDVVSIISPNCIQYGPIFIGTAAIGAPLSPINWKYTANEIVKMLEMNKTKMLIFASEVEDTVIQALKEVNRTDIQLLCIGKPKRIKARNVEDIFRDVRIHRSAPDEMGGEEIIYMPFSSGTTGNPKAVALSHNAFIANTYQYANPYHNILRETIGSFQEVTLATLPFFHISGMLAIFCYGVFKGSKIHIFSKFERDAFLNNIIGNKVSHLHAVPSLLNLLNHSPECTPESMKHLRSILSGAAPVHESPVHYLRKKINNDFTFFEVYGLTETLITHHTQRGSSRLGTTGQLLSNAEAKVINTETGELLGPNETGEICLKTPSVMKEYAGNPKATEDIFKDGWIHTGDVGYYEEDGYFFVVDRTKDLIKVQGMQVSPSELEEELQKHPSVSECSVIGVPDEKYGEVPKGFVVPKAEVTEQELQDFLKQRLSKHKQLRGGISFLDALPKSDTGKVLRRILRSFV